MSPWLLAPLAYVIGSVPTSLWVGRAVYGIDLRTRGSGNLGATNTFRVLGGRAAAPVLAADVAKGWVPTALLPQLAPGSAEIWPVVFGAAAILGHMFSFWVGFRGGKGVATSAGVFLALAPWALLVAFAVWVGAVLLTRIVSVGSILAALVLPPAVLLTPHTGGATVLWFSVALSVFVLWAHRTNLRRLREGTESRVTGTSTGEETS